jgi:thioesterase domain-containing protein
VAVLETSATGDSRIVAYVVSAEGQRPDAIELRNQVRKRLPDYMVPSAFIFLDAFPLTGSGKLDRKALSQTRTQTSPHASPCEAPADVLETRLLDLFCSVLGLNAISVSDDFFALGGHSITAAELFRQINICFSLELPLATLFHAPTVRSLAAMIRDSGAERMRAPVVQIQQSRATRAIYCIGGADGEVIVFRRLAQELGPHRPVYGLQPFRLLGPHPSIEQIASAYLQELRKQGESQPFCLVGYSFGGLVVVEMARQLKARSAPAPVVVLIDTNYPAGCRLKESRAERFERYRYNWNQIMHGPGFAHLSERVKFGLARIMHRASATSVVSLPAVPRDVSTLQLLASESYRIQSYDGRVYLFRAENQPDFFTGGPDLGWSGILSDLVIEDIPGDHGSMNLGTNLKLLASKLDAFLQDPGATRGPLQA